VARHDPAGGAGAKTGDAQRPGGKAFAATLGHDQSDEPARAGQGGHGEDELVVRADKPRRDRQRCAPQQTRELWPEAMGIAHRAPAGHQARDADGHDQDAAKHAGTGQDQDS